MLIWILAIVLLVGLLVPSEHHQGRGGWSAGGTAVIAVLTGGWLLMGGFGMWGGFMGMHQAGGWSWAGLAAALLAVGGLGAIAYGLRKPETWKETEEGRLLRLRLAKGEITIEEYDLLRQKLEPSR